MEYGQDDLEDAIDRAIDADPDNQWQSPTGPDHEDPRRDNQDPPRGRTTTRDYQPPTWEAVNRIASVDRELLTLVQLSNTAPAEGDMGDYIQPCRFAYPNDSAMGRWTDPLDDFHQKSQAGETWDDFWRKRRITIEGESMAKWDQLPDDMEAYMPVAGDTAQLHPLHFAHYRVPWFQCVTHGCHEHYGKKRDNRFWPTRRTDAQGRPRPVTRTYSRGRAEGSLIIDEWFAFGLRPFGPQENPLFPRRLTVRPLNVYTCTAWGNNDPHWGWCPTADCPMHIRPKARHYESQLNEHLRQAYSDNNTEDEKAIHLAWLQERSLLDSYETEVEDAPHDYSQELGNGFGPSGRPDEN
ncbi:hypothetical protein SMACR_09942 [Sordaria macrospora]|uniref:WGS project CABT00000000 data, contig 2.281 n=2 Tax=Sordaria macrospora TaxID=5147 RepID=F7WCU6_SORMK|nr:uncharacterized protein SMAC_09942 [Sordaria macrospora k-hell]KAA8634578.1 hypothetical protein SMACR_09942 [Sordaria macrospora]KAH7631501.1 hypothetical protein B0T09DRAFT_261817 [Sordaria sp. MPI-SDFR-AT-0083]KAH7633639.1 hypothetical protein B0T09DRAFT_258598 [Sordaria sp. MPI-SDFR-AT-0083]WPJ59978.1 hypothetical protein SMAC4_09942 [Sordaria macrospora]CCC05712.1 unnamed protein product [Sordaria macrospora k-hell]